MRELVGQDAGELRVVGLLQKAGGDVELGTAGAGGIDVRISEDGWMSSTSSANGELSPIAPESSSTTTGPPR